MQQAPLALAAVAEPQVKGKLPKARLQQDLYARLLLDSKPPSLSRDGTQIINLKPAFRKRFITSADKVQRFMSFHPLRKDAERAATHSA
jgi:hypothetical protein